MSDVGTLSGVVTRKEKHARMRIKACVFMHAYEASSLVPVEEHGGQVRACAGRRRGGRSKPPTFCGDGDTGALWGRGHEPHFLWKRTETGAGPDKCFLTPCDDRPGVGHL